jgi:hypothetical protein
VKVELSVDVVGRALIVVVVIQAEGNGEKDSTAVLCTAALKKPKRSIYAGATENRSGIRKEISSYLVKEKRKAR